ncbi:phage terminase small subunit P27 family [Devosia sp. Leaf64]|uniref:phage terminase small subunit P27 family n=1 Tax=Devosia sp. Leaf64 TaxID=1736229 RepID=UPI0007139A68|nr:phage terminase small subunit P27 family [Devosia sp. Leaf64]KQN72403.1 terminase [Devosia sp. Leaf64]
MRGRKPSTIVSGSSPVTDVPRPPSYMSRDAKAEWKRVAPILIVERKTLTEADLATLENYCIATGTMREAHRILTREGLVTAAGKKHPAHGILNNAQTIHRLCAGVLGLTPVDRSRPAMRDEGDDEEASAIFG